MGIFFFVFLGGRNEHEHPPPPLLLAFISFQLCFGTWVIFFCIFWRGGTSTPHPPPFCFLLTFFNRCALIFFVFGFFFIPYVRTYATDGPGLLLSQENGKAPWNYRNVLLSSYYMLCFSGMYCRPICFASLICFANLICLALPMRPIFFLILLFRYFCMFVVAYSMGFQYIRTAL